MGRMRFCRPTTHYRKSREFPSRAKLRNGPSLYPKNRKPKTPPPLSRSIAELAVELNARDAEAEGASVPEEVRRSTEAIYELALQIPSVLVDKLGDRPTQTIRGACIDAGCRVRITVGLDFLAGDELVVMHAPSPDSESCGRTTGAYLRSGARGRPLVGVSLR